MLATWSTILCLMMVLLSSTFMATLSPVSVFWANFTLAKVPSPIVLPISYFPTFLTTIVSLFLSQHQSQFLHCTHSSNPKSMSRFKTSHTSDALFPGFNFNWLVYNEVPSRQGNRKRKTEENNNNIIILWN